MEKIEKISKRLSYVLRHRPEKFNIKLDDEGWANVQDIIDNCQEGFEIRFKLDDLFEVVRSNDKQRFKLNEDLTKIKANQGHSIKVDLKLKPITPPDLLYHGTAERFIELIFKEGLKKMNRHHVHMYGPENIFRATNTGARHQKGKKPVLIEINASEMYKDGYIFYKTDNDVYLTDSVPIKYIKKL